MDGLSVCAASSRQKRWRRGGPLGTEARTHQVHVCLGCNPTRAGCNPVHRGCNRVHEAAAPCIEAASLRAAAAPCIEAATVCTMLQA